MKMNQKSFFGLFFLACAAQGLLGFTLSPAGAQERLSPGSKLPVLRFQDSKERPIVLDWKGNRWKILLWVKNDSRFHLVLSDLARVFSVTPCLQERCDILVIFPGRASKKPAVEVEKTALNWKEGLPVRAAFDPGGKNWDTLGIIAVPTTQLVDPGGSLRFQLAGCPQDYLERMVGVFLKEMGVRTPFLEAPRKKKTARENRKPSMYIKTAKKLLAKGMPGLAAGILEKALAGRAPDLEGGRLLGFLYLGRGETGKALKIFLSLTKAFPAALDPKAGLAACAIARGELDKAGAMLSTLERQRPDSAEVIYLQGVLFERKGLMKKAAERFKKAFLLGRPELRF